METKPQIRNQYKTCEGFDNDQIEYSLKLNNHNLGKTPKSNTLVEVKIPPKILEGTYEITADFSINSKQGDEPMGLVIHVIKSKTKSADTN